MFWKTIQTFLKSGIAWIKPTFEGVRGKASPINITVFVGVVICVMAVILFYTMDKALPEYMFIGFMGLITLGIYGITVANKNNGGDITP